MAPLFRSTRTFNLVYIFFLISEPELKNIIDKLANFVARNGPDFENMTKQKQKDNPRFSFLFGGEHFNYYQYRMTTEQASKYESLFKDLFTASDSVTVIVTLTGKWVCNLFCLSQFPSKRSNVPRNYNSRTKWMEFFSPISEIYPRYVNTTVPVTESLGVNGP